MELTEETANVVDICRLAAQKTNISQPVILNCNFEKIENETYHRGNFCFYRSTQIKWFYGVSILADDLVFTLLFSPSGFSLKKIYL